MSLLSVVKLTNSIPRSCRPTPRHCRRSTSASCSADDGLDSDRKKGSQFCGRLFASRSSSRLVLTSVGSVPRRLPIEPVALWVRLVGPALLEPRMLVRAMVDNQVEKDSQSVRMCRVNQLLTARVSRGRQVTNLQVRHASSAPVFQVAERLMNVAIVCG